MCVLKLRGEIGPVGTIKRQTHSPYNPSFTQRYGDVLTSDKQTNKQENRNAAALLEPASQYTPLRAIKKRPQKYSNVKSTLKPKNAPKTEKMGQKMGLQN